MFHRILRDLRPDYLVLRSLEADRNVHYHGGKLFDTAEHMAYFAGHYREAARFQAPIERVWGADGSPRRRSFRRRQRGLGSRLSTTRR